MMGKSAAVRFGGKLWRAGMADTSGSARRQFRVLKDNGERWIVTYGGPDRVRWDRVDPPFEDEGPDEAHRRAQSVPGGNQHAQEWRDYFVALLIQTLQEVVEEVAEEARPYIEEWLRERVLPWVTATARSAWNRIVRRQSAEPIQEEAPAQVRITDIAPSSAIALAEQADGNAQPHNLNLTPEELQKQLEDIGLLTRILAVRVRELVSAVKREDGESEERFLERRKQAEQLAVRNVTSNIQVMLDRGADLAQAIELLATYTQVFAAGSVEAASFSIEGPSQLRQQGKPRMWPEVGQLSRQADNLQ